MENKGLLAEIEITLLRGGYCSVSRILLADDILIICKPRLESMRYLRCALRLFLGCKLIFLRVLFIRLVVFLDWRIWRLPLGVGSSLFVCPI